jgi:DNA polymerase-4
MHRYSEVSRAVMAMLSDVTPLVEQLSVDEAFLDVSGARRLLGAPVHIAELVRARIRGELGLTASVGVASTKFLAKLASDLAKPDGTLHVRVGEERAFLAPLPVARLWGVGPATLHKLERMGLRTIGDVALLDEDVLARALGASIGAHLVALARNDDPRDVVPEREAKSIGAEETFARDLRTPAACDRELVRLADRVCSRLRRADIAARTIVLKVRFGNFETRTRSRTMPAHTATTAVVLETARELIAEFDVTRGVRLLGLSCSHLGTAPTVVQPALSLDGEVASGTERATRQAAIDDAVDGVRDRFGSASVRPAALLDRRPADR